MLKNIIAVAAFAALGLLAACKQKMEEAPAQTSAVEAPALETPAQEPAAGEAPAVAEAPAAEPAGK